MDPAENVRRNYEQVLERITRAEVRAGRSSPTVKLVVVTKSHPLQAVRSAIDAGARLFGENYAEEGLAKIKATGTLAGLEWHMIGHVQSRKAELVVRNFALVHSLDSFKLADRMNRASASLGWRQPVLIQVNVSGEASKFGFPAWLDDQVPFLISELERIIDLPCLHLQGLMTVPPMGTEAELSRPFFQRLRRLRDRLAQRFVDSDWAELSMGMSADYEVAVEEGATLIRVGTAILGERDHSGG